MIGLLLKDFYNLKGQLLLIAGMMVLYGFIAISNNNVEMFGFILAMTATTLPISAAAYDEKVNWNLYALTMPIKRADLVRAKYIFGLLSIISALVINWVFSLVVMQMPINELAFWSAVASMIVLISQSLLMPIVMTIGAEKGRAAMLLVFLIPVGIAYVANQLGVNISIDTVKNWHLWGGAMASLMLWGISIKITEHLRLK